jgi:hypothetical protein
MEHGADVINLSYSFGQQSKAFGDIIAEVTCAAPTDFDCRAKTPDQARWLSRPQGIAAPVFVSILPPTTHLVCWR